MNKYTTGRGKVIALTLHTYIGSLLGICKLKLIFSKQFKFALHNYSSQDCSNCLDSIRKYNFLLIKVLFFVGRVDLEVHPDAGH